MKVPAELLNLRCRLPLATALRMACTGRFIRTSILYTVCTLPLLPLHGRRMLLPALHCTSALPYSSRAATPCTNPACAFLIF